MTTIIPFRRPRLRPPAIPQPAMTAPLAAELPAPPSEPVKVTVLKTTLLTPPAPKKKVPRWNAQWWRGKRHYWTSGCGFYKTDGMYHQTVDVIADGWAHTCSFPVARKDAFDDADPDALADEADAIIAAGMSIAEQIPPQREEDRER